MNQVLDQNGRLNKLIKPIKYELYLKPNLELSSFEGEVKIHVMFNNYDSLPLFGLHCVDLQINSIFLNNIKLNDFKLDENNEVLVINQDQNIKLNKNENVITIKYSGIINNDLKGFYKSKYVENGIEKSIATTQFESTSARQAFPCFDEPNFKAVYDVTIEHNSKYTALSNSDVKNSKTVGDTTITYFNTTPVMSSYLVAFIVGELGYIESYSKSKKRVRVYCTNFASQKQSKLNFALDVSIKCLDWFEKYFEIEFPINKLDMIAIPDFSAGAMENWGLITFRPEYLLCDNDDKLTARIDTVVTIAHEMSHQWFGNYVTMEFWNYLWLNESMATYYGWLVCDNLFPEWNVWDVFIEDEYSTAFELDSLESSHQVEFDSSIVKKPDDIDQIFDGISYCKGSCLVKGLAERLGFGTFRKGMQIYMNTHKWSNTTSSDLWNAFNIAINQMKNENIDNTEVHLNMNIEKLMECWTTQTGYPIVKLNKKNNIISQNRYLKSGPNNDITKWIIPIEIAIDDGTKLDLVLNKQFDIFELPQNKNYVINPHRIGFYRVMYDIDDIKDLPFEINSLSHQILAQVLDDMFSFTFSGYQKLDIVLKIVENLDLSKINSYLVWSNILSNFMMIYKYLDKYESEQIKWKNYMKKLFLHHIENMAELIGFEDIDIEPINNQHLRPLIISFLNLMNNEKLIRISKINFSRGNHKYTLGVFVKNSDADEFNKVIELLMSNNDPQLKQLLIDSLYHTNSSEKVQHVLTNVLHHIRDQDIPSVLGSLSRNKNGTSHVWEHAKVRWDNDNIFKSDCTKVTYLVKVIASGFSTSHELNDYINFFKIRPSGTEMVINQTIERIQNKINCINRLLQTINEN